MGFHHRGVRVGWLVLLLAGCHGGGENGTTDDPTEGTDPTGTTGDPIDAQDCHALPEAEAAAWVEGMSLEPTGQSTPERLATAGAQTWELALDLLRAVPADRSVAASPTSMSLSLGMTEHLYQGGQCGDEIHMRMHYAESGDALHNTLGASIRELEGRALPAGDGGDPVVISLSQSIWDLEGGRAPEPLYGGTLHTVIGGDLSAIRTVMNCVIEAQSQGLLVDFIPPDLPASDTTSFDVNVAYLQAPWTHELTSRGNHEFTKDDGATVMLPAMGELIYANLLQDEQHWAIELPVRGGQLAVLLMMPAPEAAQGLEAYTAGLTPETLEAVRDGTIHSFVDVTLPRVDIPSETIDYYDPLGFQCEPYTLRTVLHGASVQMDEKGIKAAAATVAESWDTGWGEEPTYLRLDRPFLFFVYDQTTGFVLYSGRFMG